MRLLTSSRSWHTNGWMTWLFREISVTWVQVAREQAAVYAQCSQRRWRNTILTHLDARPGPLTVLVGEGEEYSVQGCKSCHVSRFRCVISLPR